MSRPLRWREREWRWLAACAAVLALLNALWPTLDLSIARALAVQGQFPANDWLGVQAVYRGVPWLGRGLGLLAVLLWLWPRRWRPAVAGRPGGLRWHRRLLLLGLGLWLGVGLVVNGALKEGWGRARPGAVLAGAAVYTPAPQPARQCRSNCSFVSGHAATGFVLGAVGLLSAPRQRRRWLLAGAGAGLCIGVVRMAQGGHFLSDVLYSGLAIWAVNLCIREAWLRRRRAALRAAARRAAAAPLGAS